MQRLRHGRVLACLLSGLWLCGTLPASAQVKPETRDLATRAIAVAATPITSFDRAGLSGPRHGKLDFIGGLVLSAEDAAFGGWSGIAIDPDGRGLFAVSDAGVWMSASLGYDKQGRPAGLTSVRLGPISAMSGANLGKGRDRDAEAVVIVAGNTQRGEALIAFEQNHRIGRFSIGPKGLSAPLSYIRPGQSGWRIPTSNGIEALTVLKNGRHRGQMIAFAEKLRDPEGRHRGWLFDKGTAKAFTVLDIGGFDLTDATALPDGGVLLLERRFRWFEGVRMRVRRIPASEIGPGRHLEGEVLLEADMASEIDNMEGLAVHSGPGSSLVLTIISDDNYNRVLQRTLLLQFRLSAEGKSAATEQ